MTETMHAQVTIEDEEYTLFLVCDTEDELFRANALMLTLKQGGTWTLDVGPNPALKTKPKK